MSKNLNSTSNLFVALIFSGVGITYFVGCEVDKADVTAARQNVAEEQSETESVRQADEQRVREAEKRLAEARLSAKKVPYEGGKDDIVLEKEKELVEAKQNLKQDVAEEELETEQAKRVAQQVEAKLAAKNDREAYVELANQKLAEEDKRLETFEANKNGLKGMALQEVQTDIDLLKVKRENLSDAIYQLKNADVLKWQEQKPLVEEATKRLDENGPGE